MCGIAGIIARRPRVGLAEAIRSMTARVRHRGPDDEGVSVRGQVAIGHRRLSIIDLSSRGHQPMEYDGGRYAITYNGEIYNFLELRAELIGKGFSFRSETDTEVILAAYSAWGPQSLYRFNGMWAFAIHDRQENIVFAARDRFGVKPFYYIDTEPYFAFGSEIRQLLPLLPTVSADPGAVLDFLLTGIRVQSEHTSFAGVSSLPAGHWLRYDVGSSSYNISRYYSLAERVIATEQAQESDAVDDFRATLEESVALRLRSDVRVGTCLSGGLDSSSIAVLAARMYQSETSRPFAAVTAISEDSRNSEEAYARRVIDGNTFDWITTRPSYEDFCDLLAHVVEHQEEPFGSPSICLQAFVMRAAREHGIPVLLDGQGADEVLLGYERHYAPYILGLWRESGIYALLDGVRRSVQNNDNLAIWRLAAYVFFALMPTARYSYHRWQSSFLPIAAQKPEWFRSIAIASIDVRSFQILEIEKIGLPELLGFEDKNSMTYSIETRLPFLDYRLVEKAIALPVDLKIRDGWTKYVLRKAMSDLLPADLLWRRNKISFEAPTEIWLKRHREIMYEQVCASPLLRRLCGLRRLEQEFRKLGPNIQFRFYSVSLWEQIFNVTH